jgi:hypothetical protein
MDWYQVLAILSGNFLMYVAFAKETRDFKTLVQNEMKDFHGRLCSLEEKYTQMMQRFMEKK